MAAELTNTKAEASLQSKAINTFGGNQNKSASDNELDARVDDVAGRAGGDHKSAKQSKSKLAPVKSLDSDKPKSSANQDDHHQRENHQAGQTTTTTKSNKQHQRTPLLAESHQQSTSGQHKQMFSLKQLAINSRNLAKKRAPLHQQASPGRSAFSLGSTKKAGKRKELLLGLNSLSNSSSESSEACLLEEPRNRSIPSSSGEDLEPNPESGSDRSEFSDSQEDGTSYDSDEEDDYDEEEEEEEGEGENNEMMKDKQAKKKKKKKNKLRQRQGSCCNCERFVNRIDCDGQPITDVDLVTYKHLCQMEQQAHQLRKSAAASGGVGHPLRCFKSTRSKAPTHCGLQRRQHRLGNNQLKAPTHLHDHQRTPPIVCRRSSLQEESGAYYELCTTPEERQIRQKYAWFPPSLKSTDLVDLFFSDFAKEKIPLVKATQTTTVASTAAPTTSQPQSQPQTQTATTTTTTTGNKGTSANASSSSSNGSSSLAGSHRDEQISFQLPRQDISLDYCSYPMSESSRTNYLQFVDKRNSQALDVGTVVQVKLPYANFSANSQGGQLGESSSVRHQRKASTVSQSAALVAAGSSGHQAGGQQPAYVAQRCRRCLVRFDNNQLAVLAPNFAIGTGFYRSPSLASNTTALPGYPDESTKLASRRASTVSSGGNSIMRDQPHLSTLKLANELTNSKPDATASKNIAMFHPKCFTCSTCKEFLVDLVYCLRDNKLYCLRHYGESLRPRCNWCQEVSTR